MCVPIIFLGQRFIDTVVEILVVREDDMSADIVKLDKLLELYVYYPIKRKDKVRDAQSLQV